MNNKFPAECKFRDGSGKVPPSTSMPDNQPINCFFRYLFRLLFFMLAILVLFSSLSLPSNLQAAEKKSPEQGRTGNGENVRLKYEKLNLDKEMRRAVESLLPEGFRFREYYITDGYEYGFLFNVPKAGNREHLASVLNFIDKLEDSSYSAFMSIHQVDILGRDNNKDHKIHLILKCQVKTDKRQDKDKKVNQEQLGGLFSDIVREIYLIKPGKVCLETIGFYGKEDFHFTFISYMQHENDDWAVKGVSDFLTSTLHSRYFPNFKLEPKGDSWPPPDRPRYEGIYFQLPTYSPPFSPSEREFLLNSILKTTPPIFNLSKVRFNKASKGFIIEISPQSKDKTAILKSIITFLKEFSKLKGTEELFFDRLVIHLPKDKTGIERMFIEMRHHSEVTPGGENKAVYPGSKEYGEYRDSRIKKLKTIFDKDSKNLFSDGYFHCGNDGKYMILTIQGE